MKSLIILLGFLLVFISLAESSGTNLTSSAHVETIQECRERCHEAISKKDNYYHGELIELIEAGNKESVPQLIQCLLWNRVEYHSDGSVSVPCISQHCVDALKSLTGADFKYSGYQWKIWWKEEGINLPADHYNPRNTISKEN